MLAHTSASDRPGLLPGAWAGAKRLAAFLAWVLSGFGLLGHLRHGARRTHRAGDEIVVYCVHRAFFLWALIVAGFVLAAVVARHPNLAVACGKAYAWVLLYTLATLLFDFSSLKLLLWCGVAAFVWLASTYLEELKHVVVLSAVFGYLRGLRPTLAPAWPRC